MNPSISVIMPIYNGERFLRNAIESVLIQTFDDFELIMINDASTDNSIEIMNEFKNKDDRIKIINNQTNGGFVSSLNIGIKEATGKYLACFNQDDWNFSDRFEIQFNYLEKHPEIFLVGSSAIYIDKDGREIRKFRKFDNHKIVAWRLRKSDCIIHPTTMLRNNNVLFDDYFEYGLYYNLIRRGEKITNLPEFLIKFRVHDESISSMDKERQEKLRDEVIEKFKEIKDNTTIFNKLFYSIKLLIHGIRTMNEKRIK